MIRYPRLFQKLFCQALMLESGARLAFEHTLLAAMHGEPRAGYDFDWEKEKIVYTPPEIIGSATIIQIHGVIDRKLSLIEKACMGACDVADVIAEVRAAVANPAIETIILDMDSPGGSAMGVPEAASVIRQAAERKDVVAYIGGMGASAAYYLASQANEILAAPSAAVGSIGVYCALVDMTRALEMEGYAVEFVKAGKHKAAGHPWKKLTEEDRKLFQANVDKIYADFAGAVQAKRPLVTSETMQGQCFLGRDSQALGLVDDTADTLEEILEAVA